MRRRDNNATTNDYRLSCLLEVVAISGNNVHGTRNRVFRLDTSVIDSLFQR